MPRRPLPLLLALTLCFALPFGIAACQRPAEPSATARPSASDTLRYASGFTLSSEGGDPYADIGAERFLLLDSAAAVPPGAAAGATVVRVPVRRIVTLSTTHLGFLDRLGASGRVVGVSGGAWVNTPAIRARLVSGAAADVGQTPSAEAIAALRPDVVFASAGEGDPVVAALRTLGIPVVPVAEYREAHPLGRAEWLRLFGAFVGRADTAQVAFDTVAARYERLAARARDAAPRPTVLLNSPYRGIWYVPGGRSFAARQMADAGGAYVWADDSSATTLSLSLETVLARAQHADLWLAPGAWRSLADGAAQEPRVRLFDAFRAGRVFNFDARLSDGGGFDVYETGVVQPDLVLADLVSILHPALLPGHRRVYFRAVPAR